MGGYDAQRLEIRNHIEGNGITGVIFVSGSLQFGALGKCNEAVYLYIFYIISIYFISCLLYSLSFFAKKYCLLSNKKKEEKA